MRRDLVERAMTGHHDAFAELARVTTGRLFVVARLILRDDDAAEDAAQEALVAAWFAPRLPSQLAARLRPGRDPARLARWPRRHDQRRRPVPGRGHGDVVQPARDLPRRAPRWQRHPLRFKPTSGTSSPRLVRTL